MKQMKAKIAVMVLFALIVSSINVGIKRAGAENLTTIYGQAVTAAAGQEIKVPVSIKDNQGVIAGLSVKVTYDANVMTPVKVEKGKILESFSNVQFGDTIATSEEPGSFECVAYNEENYSDNGELFILTFQISNSATAGSYELQLELTEHFDEKQDDVSVESENIVITVSDADDPGQEPVTTPDPSIVGYVWEGEWTGWGGPESYPSSADHEQGSGSDNYYWIELTNMAFAINNPGYGCGLELMNPYNPEFTGAENEMSQFIIKMKNPRIKVTLKNGGAASSWNWSTELSFPSGKEMELPEGYLDSGYFALFGNDDVITKVEIYDIGESGAQTTTVPASSPQPTGTDNNAGNTGNQNANVGQTKNSNTGSTANSQSKSKKVKKPGKVTGLDLSLEGKKLLVSWSWKSGVSGFQIQYAQNRSFTKKKRSKNAGKYAQDKVIRGLKKGKTYFVRVRAYKKASGKKAYGKWSKVKKIKIK